MPETRYTPGPWQAEHGPEGSFAIKASTADGDLYLCQRAPWPSYAETSAANAHLIAGAPALFEALQEMVDWWEKDGGSMDAAIDRSIVALAKAKGE